MSDADKAYAIKIYNDTGRFPNDITPTFDKKTGRYTVDYTYKTEHNKIVFNGKSGQKVEVGYGNYTAAWTYDANKKVWSNGKSTMTNAQFKSYIQKQNPAYVK